MIRPLIAHGVLAIALVSLVSGCASERRNAPSIAVPTDSVAVLHEVRRIQSNAHRSDAMWPGFEMSKLPILLAVQPHGPTFLLSNSGEAFPGFERVDDGIFVRGGPPPDSIAGLRLAIDWGGAKGTATSLDVHRESMPWIPSFITHETFHTYQMILNRANPTRFRLPPRPNVDVTSETVIALLNLEAHYLGAAVRSKDSAESRAYARMALAVRRWRCSELSVEECTAERAVEKIEGSAQYVAAEMWQEIPGYGQGAVALDSLSRVISPITNPSRLTRWHFYDTGLLWLLLIKRFTSSDGWYSRVEREYPDILLGQVLGMDEQQAARLIVEVKASAEYVDARSAAADLVRAHVPVAVDSSGTLMIVEFGRPRGMNTIQRFLPDGRPEKTIRLDTDVVVIRTSSQRLCCAPGESLRTVITDQTATVGDRQIRLDTPGSAVGRLSLDIPALKVSFGSGRLVVYGDSIRIERLEQ